MYRPVDGVILLAAYAVGNGYSSAYGKSDKQIDDEGGDGTGGANSAYRYASPESANDHEVGRVEQKLQNAGKDNGDGVEHHTAKQRPLQHILVNFFQNKITRNQKLHFLNSLCKIGQQILCVFQAAAQADQVSANACGIQLLVSHLAVGCAGRVEAAGTGVGNVGLD